MKLQQGGVMDEDMQQKPEETKPSKGYGKRPMWQWIVIYIIVAAIVYGFIYYAFIYHSGGSGGTGGGY
jgi:hypothetical protein